MIRKSLSVAALEKARRLYSFTTRSQKIENDHRFRENRQILFGPWLFLRCRTSEKTNLKMHDVIIS
jgi:hypothetical protein